MIRSIVLLFLSLLLILSPSRAMDVESKEFQHALRKPTWSFLQEKDEIEIILPAAAPLSDQQVQAAQDLIRNNGFKSVLPEEAICKKASRYNYYSNSDSERARYFREALQGSSKALWALRGGFGSHEVIRAIKRSGFDVPKTPKPIIGFSDITALHLLAASWEWPSLHAPVLGLGEELYSITKSKVNKDARLSPIFDILSGRVTHLEHQFDVISPGDLSLMGSPILGSVMGGNLSIIENHNGSKIALQGEGKFIFLEDTPEDPKRLNRRLLGLVDAGVFEGAKGVLIGNMPIIGFEESSQATVEAIHYFIKEELIPEGIRIPVVYSPRFGHGSYNDVMPLGTTATLVVAENKATLKVSVNESAYTIH